MEQKFRVVKYEPSKSIGATTTEALFTNMATPEKVLGTCKDGFTSKEEAENYKTAIWERNPYAHFKIESYF